MSWLAAMGRSQLIQPLKPLQSSINAAQPRLNGDVGALNRTHAPQISYGRNHQPTVSRGAGPTGSGAITLNFSDTDIRDVVAQILGGGAAGAISGRGRVWVTGCGRASSTRPSRMSGAPIARWKDRLRSGRSKRSWITARIIVQIAPVPGASRRRSQAPAVTGDQAGCAPPSRARAAIRSAG